MMHANKTLIVSYLKNLQKTITQSFETLENNETFTFKPWSYPKGDGGGIIGELRGSVFEKAAVNFSSVSGKELPFKENSGPFFATGVSLITHMMNPRIPTVHMNVRYIETPDQCWFGGGYDLTSMGFHNSDDKDHFHQTAKSTLDPFDLNLYPQFAQAAKEYFYIPHRKKERGYGGIFFDHFNTGQLEADFKMWQAVGDSFLSSVMPIYEEHSKRSYTDEDKELQNKMRAHYVEFNLIYDRGTKFGFQSNGNPEAILSSMPPCAKW